MLSSVKEDLLEMIQKMPDDVTIDDVMAELYFRDQVEAGLEQLDNGEGIAHEDVKERHSQWIET